MGTKKVKKKAQAVTPKKLKGGPKRRVTAAERAKQAELGIAANKNAADRGANQRRERARRRQKRAGKSKGCWDKLKRRLMSSGADVAMNRRSTVVVGDAMRTWGVKLLCATAGAVTDVTRARVTCHSPAQRAATAEACVRPD